MLWISGNPSKFLNGHNVNGSDNLCQLVSDLATEALQAIDLTVSIENQKLWLSGSFKLSRVDINYSKPFGSRQAARRELDRYSRNASLKYQGSGRYTGSTLYFGKKSRRVSVKMYVKGDEIDKGTRGNNLPTSLNADLRQQLLDEADDALRTELVLRSPALKQQGLIKGSAWSLDTPKKVFDLYLERMTVAENDSLSSDEILSMPSHLYRELVPVDWTDFVLR